MNQYAMWNFETSAHEQIDMLNYNISNTREQSSDCSQNNNHHLKAKEPLLMSG